MQTWVVFLFYLPVVVWAQKVEVNSTNLRTLLENKNGKVQISKLELSAATERKGSLSRSFFPSIDLYGGQESFKVGNGTQKSEPVYGVEAKVNVFQGGRDRLESESRDLEAGKKEFQAKKVLAEELEKARTAYWQLLYLQESETLTKAAIENNKQNLASANRRIQSGVATQTDRFEFEMKGAELSRSLKKIAVEIQTQSRLLTLLLGLDSGATLLTSEKFVHDHDYEKQLEHSARDHDYIVKESQLEAHQRQLKAESQSHAWWPKVDVFAGYKQYNQRDKEFANAADRTDTFVGVKATVEIPSGLEAAREAAALRQESAALETLAQYRQRELEIHLNGETAELKLLHDQVHEVEENIERAEKYYKLTLSEYARGVKNSPDVLGASDKLFDIRNRKLEIVRDFQLAKAHVLSKIGK